MRARKESIAVSVASFMKSRTIAAGLCLTLAASMGAFSLSTPSVAWADESETFTTTVISQGVCEALWVASHQADSHGQDFRTEVTLAVARQSDAAAEEQALIDINTRGERHRLLAAAAEAQAAEDAAEETVPEPAPASTYAAQLIPEDETPMAAAPQSQSGGASVNAGTLSFLGHEVSFAQGSCFDATAPNGYASTWLGDGSVTDGSNTYFIGHNPGVFAPVMDLAIGDVITVCDEEGYTRDYVVFDALILPKRSNYFEYEGRIAPMGESITLQTCCPSDTSVRCVMAR